MKRKTKICGERDGGRICEKNPGHNGPHRGQGGTWTSSTPARIARRPRRSPGQIRLPFA